MGNDRGNGHDGQCKDLGKDLDGRGKVRVSRPGFDGDTARRGKFWASPARKGGLLVPLVPEEFNHGDLLLARGLGKARGNPG